MAESGSFFASNEEDEICLSAALKHETNEALNNGQEIIHLAVLTRANQNAMAWTESVRMRINSVRNNCPIARKYLENYFFGFEQWPPYMTELFVTNNISNYSYAMRNKICIFFWGNGAQFETMWVLSQYYAPRETLRTLYQQRKSEESCRKCKGLFKTYAEQKYNPLYAERYYFYSMIENRMLFLDGKPRFNGERREDYQRNVFF